MEIVDIDSITHGTQEKERYWNTATTKFKYYWRWLGSHFENLLQLKLCGLLPRDKATHPVDFIPTIQSWEKSICKWFKDDLEGKHSTVTHQALGWVWLWFYLGVGFGCLGFFVVVCLFLNKRHFFVISAHVAEEAAKRKTYAKRVHRGYN